MQEHPTSPRCGRCHRTLTSAASIRDGYGRTCKAKRTAEAKAAAGLFAHKPHLVAKANEVLELAGITHLRGTTYQVVGSEGHVYRANPAACNCKAGLRRVLCHHRIAATIAAAADNRTSPAPAARVFALPATPTRDSLALAA